MKCEKTKSRKYNEVSDAIFCESVEKKPTVEWEKKTRGKDVLSEKKKDIRLPHVNLIDTSGFATTHVVVSVRQPITY